MNDMPVAYQSRAVTEPQREAVSRRLTEGLTPKGNSFISPKGVAKFYKRYSFVRLPGGGYFSMKKSNQKSLGEDPETPYASEPPRPETLRIPGAGLDDAYKVFILIRFLQGPK